MKLSHIRTEIFGGQYEGVIDEVVRSLQGEGFAVMTRVDQDSGVVLRFCYPRSGFLSSMVDPASSAVVKCTAIVRESEPGKISVELLRSNQEPEAALVQQVDEKLKHCLHGVKSGAANWGAPLSGGIH